jgi:hypothetical protein
MKDYMSSRQQRIRTSASVARPVWQQHNRLLIVLAISVFTLIILMFIFSRMGNNDFVLSETPLPIDVATSAPTDSSEPTTPQNLNRVSVKVRPGDTLATVFRRLKIDLSQMHAMISAHPRNKILTHVHAGDKVQFLYDNQRSVHEVVYRPNLTTQLTIRRATEGFESNFLGGLSPMPEGCLQ